LSDAIQLTHLYVKDNKRFRQVKKGLIKIEKFKEFDVPSGIKKEIYETDVNGKDISLNNKNVRYVSKRFLSKIQSNRIKKFVGK
jgi:hypothetical protein